MKTPIRRRTFASLHCGLAFAWFSLCPAALHAQGNIEKTVAETLFREGRELMTRGAFDQACPKLQESERLDPSLGTLLNLAVCYENQGKLASAWLDYVEAGRTARRENQPDRAAFADARGQALEARLPRLAIRVADGADVLNLSIALDGVALGASALGVPAPVDPGPHSVVAKQPGHVSWQATIDAKESQLATVVVPILERAPAPDATAAAVAASPPSPAPMQMPASAPAASAPSPPSAAPNIPQTTTPRTPGLVSVSESGSPEVRRPLTPGIFFAGAVTLGFTGGAIATGVLAHSRAQTYDRTNRDPSATTQERSDQRDRAFQMQLVSTLLTGAAVAGGLVTSLLIATRPSAVTRVGVAPWVSSHDAGLAAQGCF